MGNDVTIISGILIFFLLTAIVLPFITEGLQGEINTLNNTQDLNKFYNELTNLTNQTQIQKNSFSIWNVASWIPNEILVFFRILWIFIYITLWGFGSIPFYVNILIYWPLRIILIFTLARNIWVGGGS